MRGKLLFSTIGVVGLCAISIIVCANAPEKPQKKVVETVAITETVPVETAVPEQATPEPTEAVCEQETESKTPSLIFSRDWDADESYLLAKIAMAEAENQNVEGKMLVICVVLNRTWSREFPNSIKEVIYQPKQFSPIWNGRFDKVEPNEECWEALDMVMAGGWDESQGALYFESKSESTWHERNLQFLFKHGDHYFYKDKE